MPDYSLCRDMKCPSREQCFRFKAPASEYQSYADFERKEGEEACGDFLPWLTLTEVK